MTGRPSWILVFIVVLLWLTACGRETPAGPGFSVEAQLDTTAAMIGDVLTLDVWAYGVRERVVHFPEWEVADERLEIRSRRPLASETPDARGIRFQVVFWDTGRIEIPGYRVELLDARDSVQAAIATNPIPVQVVSLLTGGSPPDLRPVKGPVPVRSPLPWRALVLVLAGLAALGLMIWIWKRRLVARPGPDREALSSRPPDEVALEKLKHLKYRAPWEKGEVKQYYVELSHVLREYVENSLYLRTLEMTTAEIRTHVHLFPYPEAVMRGWLDLLERADLIKFAKHIPQLSVCVEDLQRSEQFIRETVAVWKPDLNPASGRWINPPGSAPAGETGSRLPGGQEAPANQSPPT